MVKVNHTQTEAALDKIAAAIHSQASVLENYFKESQPGEDQAMYSAQYLQGLADKALEKLVAAAKANADTFMDAIESAKECEAENEKALDFTDPTLQGILAAIDALQDKQLTTDGGEAYSQLNSSGKIIEAALEALRGQRNALELVKNKLESKGLHILKTWEPYFYGEDLFEKLDSELTNVVNSPKSGIYYFNAVRELREIAGKLGLTLRESDLDLGGIGGAVWDSAMRSAAGIQNVDLNIGVDANDYAEQKLRAAMGL